MPCLQLTFLEELPALKGLNGSYLRSLAHCFHQVHFEPREVVVRQRELSDCMYVLKSGQVSRRHIWKQLLDYIRGRAACPATRGW